MSCGIVTFYDHSNYGAVLQAYALQQTLDNMGFDAFHLSLGRQKPDVSTEGMHPFLKNMVLQGKKRDALFETFRKKYIKEKTLSPELVISTDCFIAGSDQVWNPEITGGDPAYFLQFAEPEKRISYAASFGKELKDEYKEIYRNGIKSIPFLSVRESSAADVINLWRKSIGLPVG